MTTEHLEDAFASVIGPGVKLSIAIYYFASPLGSAGDDMKDVGAEVALFCATMRQVRSTFDSPKSFRISTTALHDIHDVLARGKAIFEKIEALLNRLQNDNDAAKLYTRVKETFRKSKVLMWKESLRSCTTMVQVMLTTMAFAERIASAGKAYSSPAEDDQLRDLMQSLLLAQQSTNARLEKLEDQTLLDEMQHTDSSTPDRLGTGHQPGHRQNRSSRVILDISTDGSADNLAKGAQRTSVLLNRKIYQEDDVRESQRRTWTSLGDYRQSVAQSNDLLQTWTDQMDPSPPYMLSWHGEYAEDAYKLDELHEKLKRNEEQADAESNEKSPISFTQSSRAGHDALPGFNPLQTVDAEIPSSRAEGIAGLNGGITRSNLELLRDVPAKKKPSPPALELSDLKGRGLAENYLQTEYAVRRALLLQRPAFVVARHDYIPKDNTTLGLRQADIVQVVSQLDNGWWDGVANGTRGWFPSNFCEAVREPDDMSDSEIEQGEREERSGSGTEDEEEADDEKPEVEDQMSITATPRMKSGPPFEQGILTTKSPQCLRSPSLGGPTSNIEQTQDSSLSMEIFKHFRVSMEDPCWKVLSVALRKYNIWADQRSYALYIVYGNQERYLGPQERPLKIFRDLDTQGKRPMFVLRKLATGPGMETDTKSLRSPQRVPKATDTYYRGASTG